jgi:hypothetical protein
VKLRWRRKKRTYPEPCGYAPILLAAAQRDKKWREETYGPQISLLELLRIMEEWEAKGYEVENFWGPHNAMGYRPKGHPEEGAVYWVP